MRVQNILVATDLTAAAEPVCRWAIALARRFGSRVTPLNIDETNEFSWPALTMQGSVRLKRLLEDLSRRRSALLDEARDQVEREDIPTTYRTVVGRVSDAILDHTRSHQVDLLVMGKRGARRTQRDQ
jgi:nucleotide-binding universal stress UspA family protein